MQASDNIKKLIMYVDHVVITRSPRMERYLAHLKSVFSGDERNFELWLVAAKELAWDYQKLLFEVRSDFNRLYDNKELAEKFSQWAAIMQARPSGVLLQGTSL